MNASSSSRMIAGFFGGRAVRVRGAFQIWNGCSDLLSLAGRVRSAEIEQ
jgi:hypothetical protein